MNTTHRGVVTGENARVVSEFSSPSGVSGSCDTVSRVHTTCWIYTFDTTVSFGLLKTWFTGGL